MRWCLSYLFLLLLADSLHSYGASLVEIVLAHCKEDTTWVSQLGYGGITTSYDKCGNAQGPGTHISLPNVGREGGTFLHHIVNRYDTLADWTVFSQAEQPTYGYRGHRMGGGHLMSNVRFQDYVDAAQEKSKRPLFFVFTNVLVTNDNAFHQCIREHYGEDFIAPHEVPASQHMCGRQDEWREWVTFPVWFHSMIQLLLQEQSPSLASNTIDIQKLFQVDIKHGVTFFAQGARFAASREAIHTKTKSHYEALLGLMDKPDPWAGYFLEWLWWYALGGSSAPCGFEAGLLQDFQQWTRGPSRNMQALDLVSGDGAMTVNGTANVTGNVTAGCGQGVTLTSGSTTTISNAATISTSGCNGSIVLGENSTVNVNKDLTLAAQVFALSATFSVVGSTLTITRTTPDTGKSVLTSTTIQCDAASRLFVTGGVSADFIQCLINCPQFLTLLSGSGRRTGYTTASYCGSQLTTLAVGSGSAAEFQVNCSVTSGAYSNTVDSLTYSSGSLLVISSVTKTALPTLISSWNSPAGMPVAITTSDTGAFSTQVIRYQTTGACATTWSSVTFDNCPSGLTCSLTGSTYAGNTSYCQMTYTQASSSSNNDALLGLIALVALVPLLGLLGLLAWHFLRPSPAVEDILPPQLYYYPGDAQGYNLYPTDAPPTPMVHPATVAYMGEPEYEYVPTEFLYPSPAGSSWPYM